MRPHLDRHYLSTLIARGKWIAGHSILTAMARSADRLLLGFVMSASSFGFYFIARQITDLGLRFLNTVHSKIDLQVFAHIGNASPADFRRRYYRYRIFFDALSGLQTGALVVLAPLLVEIVFDDRYRDVAPLIQYMAWAILLTAPLVLRSAFGAERRFRALAFAGLVSTAVLWCGLAVAIFIADSLPAALLVVALHRLPEALIYAVWGWRRGWVVPWRELNVLAYCAVGMLGGWGVLRLWATLMGGTL